MAAAAHKASQMNNVNTAAMMIGSDRLIRPRKEETDEVCSIFLFILF